MRAVQLVAELATKFQAEFLPICVVEYGSPPDRAALTTINDGLVIRSCARNSRNTATRFP